MKIHLKAFHFPLIEGKAMRAHCGREIPNAKFAYIWDDVPTGSREFMDSVSTLNVCRKCYFAAVDGELGGYVYGIVPGQEIEIEREARSNG